MLKRLTNGEFVLAVLVASLFWIAVLAWSTSYAPTDPQKDACYQAAAKAGRNVDECKSFWEKATSDPVAAFTLVLAISTVGLWIATIGLYFAGEKQIKVALKAATAADLSARAAIAVELPVIRASVGKIGWADEQDETGRKRYFCYVDSLFFSNLGRTKAFPVEVQCGWTFGDGLPDVPIYAATKPFPANTIFESDTPPYDIRVGDLAFDIPPDAFDRIRDRSIKLWFYCNLIYLDFMQTRHEAGFCWRRHQAPGVGNFLADPTSAYNKKI